MAAVRTRILAGGGRWDEVRAAHEAVAAESPPQTSSQSPEWLAAASAHAHDDRTRWLVVEDERGPAAVLTYRLDERRVGPLRLRVVANDRRDDGLVAPRLSPADLRRALLAAQAEAGEPVDAIVLNGLRPGRAFLRLATALPSGLQAEVRHGGNAVLPTTVPGDEWFARAGRNLRAALRKARNRAERRGTLTITEATSPDEVAAGFDEFVAVEASGWKADAEALVNDPVDLATAREFFLGAAACGRALVRTLRLDDRPAAVQLAWRAGRTLELHKIAYDDALADLSPSNLLLADLVRACCDRPDVDRIDLVTNQPWHARWHAEVHATYQAREVLLRRPGGLVAAAGAAARALRGRLPRT